MAADRAALSRRESVLGDLAAAPMLRVEHVEKRCAPQDPVLAHQMLRRGDVFVGPGRPR